MFLHAKDINNNHGSTFEKKYIAYKNNDVNAR